MTNVLIANQGSFDGLKRYDFSTNKPVYASFQPFTQKNKDYDKLLLENKYNNEDTDNNEFWTLNNSI